jgi:hypothetical protein
MAFAKLTQRPRRDSSARDIEHAPLLGPPPRTFRGTGAGHSRNDSDGSYSSDGTMEFENEAYDLSCAHDGDNGDDMHTNSFETRSIASESDFGDWGHAP